MAIQLMSNVKIITSGVAPTTSNLLPGQAAFGKLTSDGKYHLFGNTSGEVVDIVMSTYSALSAPTLDTILTEGNETTKDILIQDADGSTVLSIGQAGVAAGTTTLTKDGFVDNGKVVLSANPQLVVSDDDASTMRGFLKVYSKTEIDGMVAGAFHVKGSVETPADLPTTNVQVGDTYNVKTGDGTKDIHDVLIKSGDNVVWVAADSEAGTPAGWDVLSGVVDLSAYYTSEQVDGLLANYYKSSEVDGLLTSYAKSADVYTKTAADEKFATLINTYNKDEIDGKVQTINTAIADAKKAGTDAQDDVDALETTVSTLSTKVDDIDTRVETLEDAGYQTAADVNKILTDNNYVTDANYVHTDNNYTTAEKTKVGKLVIDGDGTKVLKNDGTYDTLEIAVASI